MQDLHMHTTPRFLPSMIRQSTRLAILQVAR